MSNDLQKLDNPVWYSLTEAQQDLAINYGNIRFYDPSYCPFGGFIREDDIHYGIDLYSKLATDFFVIGEQPKFSEEVVLKKELSCLQMVREDKIEVIGKNSISALTSGRDVDALFNLVNKVQPGYFSKNTNKMGDYFGIYKDGILVSVAGERMKLNKFTEVSAVVTHPEYVGRGFAKQLVAHTTNKILEENKTPFLHVAETNLVAIALYEKLGFKTRRKISFWYLTRSGE